MEDFKNIITLLNNPETLELGATLAVSQGLGEKIVSLYKIETFPKRVAVSLSSCVNVFK